MSHSLAEVADRHAQVAVGLAHSVVCAGDGEVFVWGGGRAGQLGLGTQEDTAEPECVGHLLTYKQRIVEVACGRAHTLVLADNGYVFCWGAGEAGQLGLKHANLIHLWPQHLRALRRVKVSKISAGTDHCAAVTENGELYTWGHGSYGNLGHDASNHDELAPRRVDAMNGLETISAACGSKHTLALTRKGDVYAFGYGGNGRLGTGDTAGRFHPTLVGGLGGRVLQVAAGESHSMALNADGHVFTWGSGEYGKLGHGDLVDYLVPRHVRVLATKVCIHVAAGAFNSFCTTASGGVFAFGGGLYGRLGLGHSENVVIPTAVRAVKGKAIYQIAAGPFHTIMLADSGDVYGFGLGANGRLGTGSTANMNTPSLVLGLQGKRFYVPFIDRQAAALREAEQEAPQTLMKAVQTSLKSQRKLVVSTACGLLHTLTVTDTGEVWSFGSGANGRLGTGTTADSYEPKQVKALTKERITMVAAGMAHSLAVTDSGLLYTWGLNEFGQLGIGNRSDALNPRRIIGLLSDRKVEFVVAGEAHSMALTATREVWTWGSGVFGKLGHDDEEDRGAPTLVKLLQGKGVKQIACGALHNMALTESGEVFTWGSGWYGKLGHGDTSNRTVPTLVHPLKGTNIQCIACGAMHSMAISETHELYTWGFGDNGRLGHGDAVDQMVPKKVQALEGLPVLLVKGGEAFSVCLLANGNMFAWGRGGRLGIKDDKAEDKHSPILVKSLAGVPIQSLTVGPNHAIVTTATGDVLSWGSNFHGRLGTGDTRDQPEPRVVETLSLSTQEEWGRYKGQTMAGKFAGAQAVGVGAPGMGLGAPGAPLGGVPAGVAMPGAAIPGATLGAMPGAMPGAAMPGAAMPGAAMPGAAMPGAMPGAVPGAMPGGAAMPGAAMLGAAMPGAAMLGGAVPGAAVSGAVPGMAPGIPGAVPLATAAALSGVGAPSYAPGGAPPYGAAATQLALGRPPPGVESAPPEPQEAEPAGGEDMVDWVLGAIASGGVPPSPATLQQCVKQEDPDAQDQLHSDERSLHKLHRLLDVEAEKYSKIEEELLATERKIRNTVMFQQVIQEKLAVRSGFKPVAAPKPMLPKEQYETMLSILQKESKYLGELMKVMKKSERDILIPIMMERLFDASDREEKFLLAVFRVLMNTDINSCKDVKSVVDTLMGNEALFNPVFTQYTGRKPCRVCLKDTFALSVGSVCEKPDLDLEIDPVVIYKQILQHRGQKVQKRITLNMAQSDAQVHAVIEPRVQKLTGLLEMFLSRIIDSVDFAPFGVRWIGKYLRTAVKKKFPTVGRSDVNVLTGKLLWNQFFEPSVLKPFVEKQLRVMADTDIIDRKAEERAKKRKGKDSHKREEVADPLRNVAAENSSIHASVEAYEWSIAAKPLSLHNTRTLEIICLVFRGMARNEHFVGVDAFLSPFNRWLDKNSNRWVKYVETFVDVDELEVVLEAETYMEHVSAREKVIQLSYNDGVFLHYVLEKYISDIATDEKDPIGILVREMGTVKDVAKRIDPSWEYDDTRFPRIDFERDKTVNLALKRKFEVQTMMKEMAMRLDVAVESASKSLEDEDMCPTCGHSLVTTTGTGLNALEEDSPETHYADANRLLRYILRNTTDVPPPAPKDNLYDTLLKMKRDLQKKENFSMADKVQKLLDKLDTLEERSLLDLDHDNRPDYSVVIRNLAEDMHRRAQRREFVKRELDTMHHTYAELHRGLPQLRAHVDTYKGYLKRISSRTFQPNSEEALEADANPRRKGSIVPVKSNSVHKVVDGPYRRVSVGRLRRMKVIRELRLPWQMRLSGVVHFASWEVGRYSIVCIHRGRTIFQREVELGQLLEMRHIGQEELDTGVFVFGVSKLLELMTSFY